MKTKKFMINIEKILEMLKTKPDGTLCNRERRDLEFKEQFNFAGLGEYFKDFAAFANNIGGYLIFGVSDSPRKLLGLSPKAIDSFEKIDPEKISKHLIDCFSPTIEWDQELVEYQGKYFGVFYIYPCTEKPVIARKNSGENKHILKNGEIYYRYSGRTQTIEFSELSTIIQRRIEDVNKNWLNLVGKIGKIGPCNAAVLDTERGIIEKTDNQILLIDEKLLSKIKFIKEGSFNQKDGATSLKVVGDVHPVDSLDIVKYKKAPIIDLYPLTYTQMVDMVIEENPILTKLKINEFIKKYKLKENEKYSTYNFRNKLHQEEYEKTGIVMTNTPSIYKKEAVKFILDMLSKEESE